MAIVFGLDFGTTNALVSYITEIDEKVIHFVDREKTPHILQLFCIKVQL